MICTALGTRQAPSRKGIHAVGDERAPFRLLTVCTGNICRSPAVERMLAAALGPTVIASSAGTAALAGEPMDPPMGRLVSALGVDVGGFAARHVTERLLRDADLILALTRDHRARLVDLAPATVRRAYTLLEFARIVRAIDLSSVPPGLEPGERLRIIAPLAASMRPVVRRAALETDDVPDPYRRGPAAYEHALELIRAATVTIVSAARG